LKESLCSPTDKLASTQHPGDYRYNSRLLGSGLRTSLGRLVTPTTIIEIRPEGGCGAHNHRELAGASRYFHMDDTCRDHRCSSPHLLGDATGSHEAVSLGAACWKKECPMLHQQRRIRETRRGRASSECGRRLKVDCICGVHRPTLRGWPKTQHHDFSSRKLMSSMQMHYPSSSVAWQLFLTKLFLHKFI
jgi:hypothetical protein